MKRLFRGFAAWVLLMGLAAPAKAQYTYSTFDVPDATNTYAYGINNAGQIVGYYTDSGGKSHGFLLDVDGSYTTLDVPGATATYPVGINDAGQIVGGHTVFHGTVYMDYGFLLDVDRNYTKFRVPGSTDTFAYGINASGQIVGLYLSLIHI